jgi:uncharacterized membrane protein
MSTTTAPASTSTPKLATVGAPVVSIYTLTIFLVAFGIAYLLKNETAMTMMFGGIVSMAGTVVNFWVGSSAGSQNKDATITALSAPVPPPPAPPAQGVVP